MMPMYPMYKLIAEDDMEPNAQSIVANLKKSLEAGSDFAIYFQPQFDCSRQVTGCEALIRWVSPVLGEVSPAVFIPVAEESDLINEIGLFVIEKVIMVLKEWETNPALELTPVAVNVSARQLESSQFLGRLVALLAKYDIAASRIHLELTETAEVKNVKIVKKTLSFLRENMMLVGCDDFGTGYSGLKSLLTFPYDFIKIDQSLVRGLMDKGYQETVRAAIQLGQRLQKCVYAEGVEYEFQESFLRNAGCDRYQGFFYSKPLPYKDFMQWVRKPVFPSY